MYDVTTGTVNSTLLIPVHMYYLEHERIKIKKRQN